MPQKHEDSKDLGDSQENISTSSNRKNHRRGGAGAAGLGIFGFAVMCIVSLPDGALQFAFITFISLCVALQGYIARKRAWWAFWASLALLLTSISLTTLWCTVWAPLDLPSDFGTPIVFLQWAIGFAILGWHFLALPVRFFSSSNGKLIASGLVGALALSSAAAALTTAGSLSQGYERSFSLIEFSATGTPTAAEEIEVVYTCDNGRTIIPFTGEGAYRRSLVPFYCSKETVTVVMPPKYAIAQGAPADTLSHYDSTIDVTSSPMVRWIALLRSTITFGIMLPERKLGELQMHSDEVYLTWESWRLE